MAHSCGKTVPGTLRILLWRLGLQQSRIRDTFTWAAARKHVCRRCAGLYQSIAVFTVDTCVKMTHKAEATLDAVKKRKRPSHACTAVVLYCGGVLTGCLLAVSRRYCHPNV